MQEVMLVDRGRNLVYVKGQVPGQKGGWVRISDASKGNRLSDDLLKKVGSVNGWESPEDTMYASMDDLYPIFKMDDSVDGNGLPGNTLKAPVRDTNPIVYDGDGPA
jgi:hypothetical protein